MGGGGLCCWCNAWLLLYPHLGGWGKAADGFSWVPLWTNHGRWGGHTACTDRYLLSKSMDMFGVHLAVRVMEGAPCVVLSDVWVGRGLTRFWTSARSPLLPVVRPFIYPCGAAIVLNAVNA